MIIRLSSKGQVTIPKAMRQQLGIGPGSPVIIELVDGAVVIRPCTEQEARSYRAQSRQR